MILKGIPTEWQKKGTEYKTSKPKKNFFGAYLARNEPDKILCRAGTFGYKSTEKKVIGRTLKESEDPETSSGWQNPNKNPPWSESKRQGDNTDEGETLSTMECCEYGLGSIRWEISLDHSDTVRQARVGARTVSGIFCLYFLYRQCREKRYSNRISIIDETITWTDLYLIDSTTSLPVECISCDTGESISDLVVPIDGRQDGWLRRDISEGYDVATIGSREHIYTWEYYERTYCLYELDSTATGSLGLSMFHTFTKRTKQL